MQEARGRLSKKELFYVVYPHHVEDCEHCNDAKERKKRLGKELSLHATLVRLLETALIMVKVVMVMIF